MALLAAKVILSPLCVVGVSLAGRRWGLGVAGVLGGLPVVAGPILLVETLMHGTAFGAEAAAGALLGLIALAAFVVVYARLAPLLGPIRCVFCGWLAFVGLVAVLNLVQPPPALSLAAVCACFALGLRLLPAPASTPAVEEPPPWWDLPGRGLVALALVLSLTAVSGALGPHLSGLLAPFPILTCILAAFTHAHRGVEQVVLLSRGFLLGFYTFASFFFALALALQELPSATAFALAASVSLAVQAATTVLSPRLLAAPASP